MNQSGGKKYEYELTLKVKDGGLRSFTAADGVDSQDELADGIAFNVHRMFGILNDPPSKASVVEAMSAGGCRKDPLHLLAILYRMWGGRYCFEECVRVTVDVARLRDEGGAEGGGKDAERIRRYLALFADFAREGTIEPEAP